MIRVSRRNHGFPNKTRGSKRVEWSEANERSCVNFLGIRDWFHCNQQLSQDDESIIVFEIVNDGLVTWLVCWLFWETGKMEHFRTGKDVPNCSEKLFLLWMIDPTLTAPVAPWKFSLSNRPALLDLVAYQWLINCVWLHTLFQTLVVSPYCYYWRLFWVSAKPLVLVSIC